jgi:hypothetical protein
MERSVQAAENQLFRNISRKRIEATEGQFLLTVAAATM